MKKEVISICPICNHDLIATHLHCNNCNIDLSGDFALNKLNGLSKEQMKFVELFVINKGNIKTMEKELGLSYPTVKKILNEVVLSMKNNETKYNFYNEDLSKECINSTI